MDIAPLHPVYQSPLHVHHAKQGGETTCNSSKLSLADLVVAACVGLQGLYMGVGLGLGGVVGGVIYDHYGARCVFYTAAAVMAVGWLLVSIAQLMLRCWHGPAEPRTEGLLEPLLRA